MANKIVQKLTVAFYYSNNIITLANRLISCDIESEGYDIEPIDSSITPWYLVHDTLKYTEKPNETVAYCKDGPSDNYFRKDLVDYLSLKKFEVHKPILPYLHDKAKRVINNDRLLNQFSSIIFTDPKESKKKALEMRKETQIKLSEFDSLIKPAMDNSFLETNTKVFVPEKKREMLVNFIIHNNKELRKLQVLFTNSTKSSFSKIHRVLDGMQIDFIADTLERETARHFKDLFIKKIRLSQPLLEKTTGAVTKIVKGTQEKVLFFGPDVNLGDDSEDEGNEELEDEYKDEKGQICLLDASGARWYGDSFKRTFGPVIKSNKLVCCIPTSKPFIQEEEDIYELESSIVKAKKTKSRTVIEKIKPTSIYQSDFTVKKKDLQDKFNKIYDIYDMKEETEEKKPEVLPPKKSVTSEVYQDLKSQTAEKSDPVEPPKEESVKTQEVPVKTPTEPATPKTDAEKVKEKESKDKQRTVPEKKSFLGTWGLRIIMIFLAVVIIITVGLAVGFYIKKRRPGSIEI